jgi:hypothetical protein
VLAIASTYGRRVTVPGSPAPLAAFARFCRAEIDAVIAGDEMPSLLFAHGPDFPVALTLGWQLIGERPDNEELIEQLLPAWIDQTGASQVAIAMPFGRPRPGTTLVALDELESLVERSYVDVARLRLSVWQPIVCHLNLSRWQRTLAENAGWHRLAKWRCRRCGSVCPGEADEAPTPCDYCQSTKIEPVAMTTPLRDPDPPWNETLGGLLESIGGSTGLTG